MQKELNIEKMQWEMEEKVTYEDLLDLRYVLD